MLTTDARSIPAVQAHLPDSGTSPPPAMRPETPLIWWRTKRPDQLFRKDSATLRWALTATHVANEHRWRDVAFGDPEGSGILAIEICVRQIQRRGIIATEVDSAASAVLANALLGETASTIILAWALGQRARVDPSCDLLSDLWLIANY